MFLNFLNSIITLYQCFMGKHKEEYPGMPEKTRLEINLLAYRLGLEPSRQIIILDEIQTTRIISKLEINRSLPE